MAYLSGHNFIKVIFKIGKIVKSSMNYRVMITGTFALRFYKRAL